MTINSETRVAGPFEGNDSTVTFPFAFKVFDSDELLVVRAADAGETVLVLGADYSVTLNPDQNASPGGSVTLAVPLATDSTLTLTSDLEFLQPLDLTNQGGFYPRVINNAFDRVTILLQQLKAIANRTLKFPLSDGAVGDLPGRAARAGAVLAFDHATGEPIAGPNIAQLGSVAAGLEAIATVAPHVDAIEIVADNITDVTNFADVYYGANATDPATRKDGTPLQPGDLYFNTVLSELRSYNGVQWGGGVTGTVTVQNLSGNGTQTEFLLDYAPESEIITQIFIHGVYQQKNTYEIGGPGGATLIFDTAPPAGTDNIEVVVSSLSPSDDVLRSDILSGDFLTATMIKDGTETVAQVLARLKGTVVTLDGIPADGTDVTAQIQAVLDANPYTWITGGDNVFTVKTLLLNNHQRLTSIRFKTLGGAQDYITPLTADGRVTPKFDIVIHDCEVDGNRANQIGIGLDISGDGARSGISLLGHVYETLIDGCYLHHCATDGIMCFSNVVSFPAFRDVTIRNTRGLYNRRHGGSIDSTFGVTVEGCTFKQNGRDLNTTDPLSHGNRGSRQLGSLYGNGFDAESYGLGTHCFDLRFINCTMTENSRSGLLILPNANDFALPGYRNYTNIKINDGEYDDGYEAYDGKASIIVSAINATAGMRVIDTLDISGAALGAGLGVTNTRNARIRCRIDAKTSTGVHAGIINCDNIDIDISTTQPPVYEIVNSSVAHTREFTGVAAPTLSVVSGLTITGATAGSPRGSKYTGMVYRITGTITLTGADANAFGLFEIAGRTVASVTGVAINNNNNTVVPIGYSSVSARCVFKPGALAAHTLDIEVTVF